MQPASIRLNDVNQSFIDQYLSIHKDVTKSVLINKAMELFRKYSLQKELIEYARTSAREDRELADTGFEDYLKIIDGN